MENSKKEKVTCQRVVPHGCQPRVLTCKVLVRKLSWETMSTKKSAGISPSWWYRMEMRLTYRVWCFTMAVSDRHRRFRSRFQCSNASYTLPSKKHTKANWSSPVRYRKGLRSSEHGALAAPALHDLQRHRSHHTLAPTHLTMGFFVQQVLSKYLLNCYWSKPWASKLWQGICSNWGHKRGGSTTTRLAL